MGVVGGYDARPLGIYDGFRFIIAAGLAAGKEKRVSLYFLNSEETAAISAPHFSINFFCRSFKVMTLR